MSERTLALAPGVTVALERPSDADLIELVRQTYLVGFGEVGPETLLEPIAQIIVTEGSQMSELLSLIRRFGQDVPSWILLTVLDVPIKKQRVGRGRIRAA